MCSAVLLPRSFPWKRTHSAASLPYSESSLRCAPVAVPNIPPSPTVTALEVARVIATFTLLGLSMTPQSCQKLERVV
eukprot:9483209-Pyramimonas_sp.AAC.1